MTARIEGTSDAAPSLVVRTLSAASPEVDVLGSQNEWTVTNLTTVLLPSVPLGSFLVHVKSGFQNIVWPGGVTTYGATSANTDVWITLTRSTGGWSVLIPSTGGGGSGVGVETGWVTIFGAISMSGALTYTAGGASHLGPGWGVAESGGIGSAAVLIRRTGNVLFIKMQGLKPITGTPAAVFFRFAGIPTTQIGFDYGCSVPALSGAGFPYSPIAIRTAQASVGGTLVPALNTPSPATTLHLGNNGDAIQLCYPLTTASTWGM